MSYNVSINRKMKSKEQLMKVGIRQKVLVAAMEKGALASISELAQTDSSNMALIIKSVKMTATDKLFTIESATSLVSVRYDIPVSGKDDIVVKEAGSIVVPAKELLNWVKVQGKDSTINMALQKFEIPEIINTLDGVSDEDSKKFSIKKIGNVKLSSKNDSKTNGKWELDCYDPEQIVSVNYGHKAKKNFEINGGQLIDGFNKTLFIAPVTDNKKHITGASMQILEKELYIVTTDSLRIAVYQIPKQHVSNIESTDAILIPAVLLGQVSKIIDKEETVSFFSSEDMDKVYLIQSNLKIRLVSFEKQISSAFPSVTKLLDKKYEELTSLPRSLFNELLINAAVVNSSSALFSFSKENKTLTVKAISEANKYKPNSKDVTLDSVSKDAKVVWGVTHLLEGLKVMKDENVQINLPDNSKSMKFVGKGSENFSYFIMAPENKIYSSDMAE